MTDPVPVRAETTLPSPVTTTLTGVQKALVFLVSVDEDVATRVIAHLDPGELERIRRASESTAAVPQSAVHAVQREFLANLRGGGTTSLLGSERYLERLVRSALGDSRARELFPKEPPTPADALPAYRRLPAKTLAALLEAEHPQTIALLLTQLEPDHGAETLALLPEHVRAEVVLRVGHLEAVPEQILEQLETEFRSHLDRARKDIQRKVDGKEAAAGILKRLGQDESQALLERVAEADSAMAESLQQALFTFADLIRMDTRGMQQLLKEVPTDQLVLALKTASDDLKNKVLSNLSTRAADMLREDLALLGPTRIADVEAAQRAIVDIALQLERDGRVTIAREGGGGYV
jgi:flagellar motor switch protein FliG